MLLRLASKDQQQEVQEGLDAFRKAILEAVEKVGEFAPWVQQSELFGECCWVKVNEKNCRHTFQGCFPDAKKLCSQGWQVGSGKLAGTFGAHEALAQGGKGPFYTEVSQEPKLLGVSGALDLDPLGFLSIERGAPESLIPRARLWSRSAEVDGRDSEPLLCQSLECGSVAALVCEPWSGQLLRIAVCKTRDKGRIQFRNLNHSGGWLLLLQVRGFQVV